MYHPLLVFEGPLCQGVEERFCGGPVELPSLSRQSVPSPPAYLCLLPALFLRENLARTPFSTAQVDTLRLHFLKIGARV